MKKKLLQLTIDFLAQFSVASIKITEKLHRLIPRAYDNNLFVTLAPKILTDEKDLRNINPYLENLKKAINTPGIQNIALAGNYGSGKSTILKTFQYHNRQFNYLNISLASFSSPDSNKTIDKIEFERALEVSILQQMFYHVKPTTIPDSRFKRIINIKQRSLIIPTIYLLAWVLSAIILFKFEKLPKLNPDLWSFKKSWDYSAVIAATLFFSGVGYIANNVYRFLKNSKISKLNLKGEVELGESTDKSVFNQYIEEILYFFERTNYNVVLIEDIDRFDNTDIFSKLREINVLINNSKLINREIKFIYAVKDEMFKNMKDRVKFFEYIIPVIPFINPSNASDQLSQLLENLNLAKTITADFYSDVVSFIDSIDMRLLINIVNEFFLYHVILSKNLKQDNLFAIIVYKNLLPEDFAALSQKEGILNAVLSKRTLYISNLTKNLKEQIKEIEDEIKKTEKEPVDSLRELRAIYINQIANRLKGIYGFYSDKVITLNEATEDENFEIIRLSDNIIYAPCAYDYNNRIVQGNPIRSGIKLADIEKIVSEKFTYSQREKYIINKVSNRINDLKNDIQRLTKKIQEIESYSISELFSHTDSSSYLKSFEKYPLIQNFIINGYIDEYYTDYISLLHEGSLTKDDYNFILDVKSGKKSISTFELKNVENVFKKIPVKYFSRDSVFNIYLIDYILTNDSRLESYVGSFFQSLDLYRSGHFQFILDFTSSKAKNITSFISYLSIHQPDLWEYLNTKSNLSRENLELFLGLIFDNAMDLAIEEFTNIETLIEYIKKMPNILDFSSKLKNTNKLKNFLIKQEILVEKLDHSTVVTKDFFEFIYQNDLYQLNLHNISAVLINLNIPFDFRNLIGSYYTGLLGSKQTKLLLYISDNIELFVSSVLLNINNNNAESEETVIFLLNSNDLSYELKNDFIKTQNSIITTLDRIANPNVFKILFETNKISATWSNIAAYLKHLKDNNFDESVITYLSHESNSQQLSKQKLENATSLTDSDKVNIVDNILYNKNLTDEVFEVLLASISDEIENIKFDALSDGRIKLLISKGLINFTLNNFIGVEEFSPANSIYFIENNSTKFLENIEQLSMNASLWSSYIKSLEISDQNKLEALKSINTMLILEDNSLAESIFNFVFDKLIHFHVDVWKALFNASEDLEKKVHAIKFHLSHFPAEDLKPFIISLGNPYDKIFENVDSLSLPINQTNTDLLNFMVSKLLLLNYKRTKDKKHFYLNLIPTN